MYGQLVMRQMAAETERMLALRSAAKRSGYAAVTPQARSSAAPDVRAGRRLAWRIGGKLRWPQRKHHLPAEGARS
jgi:hypothetical protein